ncbi:MAG: GyrI-like domain-containing protein [Deltaproteobacteria bacterium]|nr:GyrI-like domain-containing protein [Deltaproteobacteria bacterium]
MSQLEFETIEKESFLAASIKKTVSTIQLGKVMGPSYFKIKEFLKSNDAVNNENNTPFCIYRNVSYDNLDKSGIISTFKMMFLEKWEIEMGIPLSKEKSEISPGEEIEITDFPKGKYIKTIHMGPYREIRQTYKQIKQYAEAQNLTLGSTSIETYFNDPGSVPENELKTEVLVAIK